MTCQATSPTKGQHCLLRSSIERGQNWTKWEIKRRRLVSFTAPAPQAAASSQSPYSLPVPATAPAPQAAASVEYPIGDSYAASSQSPWVSAGEMAHPQIPPASDPTSADPSWMPSADPSWRPQEVHAKLLIYLLRPQEVYEEFGVYLLRPPGGISGWHPGGISGCGIACRRDLRMGHFSSRDPWRL